MTRRIREAGSTNILLRRSVRLTVKHRRSCVPFDRESKLSTAEQRQRHLAHEERPLAARSSARFLRIRVVGPDKHVTFRIIARSHSFILIRQD